MKALDRRILRNLKSNLGKYLAIFILLTATIGFGSGFLSVADSVEKTLNDNQIECNIENGNFTLSEKYDFSSSERNIEENFYINLENNYTLRVYAERSNINKLTVFEGDLPEKLNEIALDRAFAKSNDIKINDEIKIDDTTFKVVGMISAPDYSSLFKNNTDLMMNTTDFGIGFVSNDTFSKLENSYNTNYNYSYTDDTGEIKEFLINKGIIVKDLLPKESNQSIMFLANDMGSDVPAIKVLIYIVIVIIAFVFVILASNNIDTDAKSIGTLKALGYSSNEITIHYLKLPVYITLLSAIIGNILGYTLFITPFKDIYYTTYSLPPLNLELNMEAFILTTIIPIIIMILINYIMLRKKLKFKTINFLRSDIKKNKTRNIKLSAKIPFKRRFRLRVVLDNLGNFVILFLGIFLASLILLFAIGLEPMLNHYEETVKDTVVANYQYVINTPIAIDEYNLTQYSMKTYYEIGGKDVDVSFVGLNDTTKYYKNLELKDLEEGIVISDSLALKLDINIGDMVEFKDENRDKKYEFKVLDIYEYRAGFSVFVKQKDLNKLLELPESYFNVFLSDEKLDIDKKYVINEISKEDVANVASQMLKSFDELLDAVIVFAVVIYLVLMYVLTKVIIEKNALSISLMKVFGYNNKEIRKLYLNATSIAVIVCLFLVMPIEKITFGFIMKYAMARIEGYVELFIPLYVFAMVVGIGIATYFVINKLHIRKINKIPMGDALKDRE
mgnify:CR=1 FL=1